MWQIPILSLYSYIIIYIPIIFFRWTKLYLISIRQKSESSTSYWISPLIFGPLKLLLKIMLIQSLYLEKTRKAIFMVCTSTSWKIIILFIFSRKKPVPIFLRHVCPGLVFWIGRSSGTLSPNLDWFGKINFEKQNCPTAFYSTQNLSISTSYEEYLWIAATIRIQKSPWLLYFGFHLQSFMFRYFFTCYKTVCFIVRLKI